MGVARGTVSGWTGPTAWGANGSQPSGGGLAIGFVAATEPLWFGWAVALRAAWVKAAPGARILLGIPLSALAAGRKARRSAADPDWASVQGMVARFLGFADGASVGCSTGGVVLPARRVRSYPNPAVFVTRCTKGFVMPVTARHALLLWLLAWPRIGTVALRAARLVDGDATPCEARRRGPQNAAVQIGI